MCYHHGTCMNCDRSAACKMAKVHAHTVIRVHACTMIVVYACIMIIVRACTMITVISCITIIVHARPMMIVLARIRIIARACSMIFVHAYLCHLKFMFHEILGSGSLGEALKQHRGVLVFWGAGSHCRECAGSPRWSPAPRLAVTRINFLCASGQLLLPLFCRLPWAIWGSNVNRYNFRPATGNLQFVNCFSNWWPACSWSCKL